MKKCGSRSSVHTADGFTSISLLRVDEHLILPELRPGVSRRLVGCHGGWPTGKRAAAHEWQLHHGMLWQRAHVRALLALYPRARPPAALHHCCRHLNRSSSSLVLARAEASRCMVWRRREEERDFFLSPIPLQSPLSALDVAMASTGAFPCAPVIHGCCSAAGAAALSASPAAGRAGSTICRLRSGELAPPGDKLQGASQRYVCRCTVMRPRSKLGMQKITGLCKTLS